MAEIVINLVSDKFVPWLVDELKLIEGVPGEIDSIKKKLENIKSCLKDADTKAAAEEEQGNQRSESLKTLVKQLREDAYHIEDVIDEYMVDMALAQLCDHDNGCIRFLLQIVRWIRESKARHKIAAEIPRIKLSVEETEKSLTTHELNPTKQQASSQVVRNVGHSPAKETEVVGIESRKYGLLKLLGELGSQRTVISIVGMPGLGKTTLARQVYDDKDVTRQFKCRAWISVHRGYIKQDLLRNMVKALCSSTEESTPIETDTMAEESLIDKLEECLKEKRYLVVFDDVWEKDFWGDVKRALFDSDNDKGNRIIVTTRDEGVANSCREYSRVRDYPVEYLNSDEAWKLFCLKAFQFDNGGCCPEHLKDLSREIVDKCGGLPIAITAVGGYLATKQKDVLEWKKLCTNFGSQLGSDSHLKTFFKALSECYNNLPYHLKSCLLYFGLFPAGCSVSRRRLIRMWIAEGFVIKQRGPITLEEVAGDYLAELIFRSLVQVSETDFDEKPITCRVHDLVHEFILGKAEELGLSQVLEVGHSSSRVKARRISVHESTNSLQESIADSKIRSVILFKVHELLNIFQSTLLAHNFKLIKLLDFQEAPLDYLPEEVGNLYLLTYLSVRDTKVATLPKSIGKLRHLETLDLKRSLVNELPVEINKLKNLRHLLVYRILSDRQRGVKIQKGFGYLRNLQKLCFLEANQGINLLAKDLGNLSKLRKLGILMLNKEDGNKLCSSIKKMKNLESLDISSSSKEAILDLQSMDSPPLHLQRLYLKGRLEKLPDWIVKLQHLKRIRLYYSGLTDDPLKVLKALPNLLELGLNEAYDCEQLPIEKGSFLKLKILCLYGLEELKDVNIEEGALPILEELRIYKCPQLTKMPTGIEHLRNLKELWTLELEFSIFMNSVGRFLTEENVIDAFWQSRKSEKPAENPNI